MATICNPLTGGIPKGCLRNKGGISKIYITDFENVTDISIASPSGEIDGITMASGKVFYEFEFNKNTSTWAENTAGDQAAGTQIVTQTITLVIARREKTKRDRIQQLMGFKELMVIIKDANGVLWLAGEESGIIMTTNASVSGTAAADPNNYTITLVGEETAQANTIESETVITAVT